ncbi:phosphatase PAP2 family protein [Eupransor demetentiae]|uniref:Membrane-associated phospholipid phosphatase (PgpB) n=1 Tax=Eupransor demetentiae TaxID=3109584 RepID=A0ABP0EQA8_9LACO|nr:Membrane-associated phospholipid phosphatase (PgpB) [Lactobacillaceae bacterium LMG 33000]
MLNNPGQSANFVTYAREKKIYIILMILGLLSLSLASAFDYQISHAVINQNSIFGVIFQTAADQGANLLLIIAFQILAFYSWQRDPQKLSNKALSAGFIALSFNQILALLQDFLSYLFSAIHNAQDGIALGKANNTSASLNYPESLRWLLAIVLLLFIMAAIWHALSRLNEADLNYLLRAALVAVVLVFVANLTINEMKSLWGRYRPYETILAGHPDHFTPWYHLNGMNGHNSFPSGHTTSGWLWLYLPFFIPRSKVRPQLILTVLGLSVAILTALSRVRIGAHWLSDVTVASLIVGNLVFLASRLLQAHFVEHEKVAVKNS